MNIPSILALAEPPMMLKVIFWILLILWAIGELGFRDNALWIKGSGLIGVILFAILGFYVFGF